MAHIPRKRFGQHFLTDRSVLVDIAAAIDPQRTDRLIEIGPGQAALTRELLKHVDTLTAIEIDRDLAADLAQDFPGGNLTVITDDVLNIDFTALRGDGPRLRIVGNLPYNISTPLLFHLLEHRDAIHDMHFMLQKEVVDRMAAGPGGKDYGRLSVMLAPWAEVESLFDVGPEAFRPPPRVESSVVRVTPRARTPFELGSHRNFDIVVRAAFAQRRKTLRNSLGNLFDAEILLAHDVDPGARAETISAEKFARLALYLDRNEPR